MTAQVKVEILGDAKSVQRAFGSAEKSVGKFSRVTETAFGTMAGVLGAGLVDKALGTAVDFLGDAITAGSDLAEQTSKLGVVFGDSAGDINAWSKTTAKAIGLSERSSKTAAGTFGTLLKGVGKNEKESAEWSKTLTVLAADMASFNNADISDTLAAIQSGLRGELEPLRKYGVNLSDATLKQEALAQGIYDGKGALTDQQKATAALGVIMAKTTDQQGDFARTSDGLANMQRANAAAIEDFSGAIGTALLPAITAIVSAFTENVLPVLMQFADVIGPIISEALAVVVPILENLGNNIVPALALAWEALQPGISAVANMVQRSLLPAVKEIADALSTALAPILAKLGPLFAAWAPHISNVLGILASLAGIALKVLVPALVAVITIAGKLIEIMLGIYTIVGKVVSAISGLILTIVRKLAPQFSRLIDVGKKIIGSIVKGIESMGGVILDAILDLIPGPVRDIVAGAVGLKSAPAAMTSRAATARGGRRAKTATTYSPNVSIQVMSADPEEVVRALRRWASANGGMPAFERAMRRAGS